ncbi:CBS domain-containing protein [Bacillus sp. JCM 19041]|uniref:CBS domain-containing protein n=1 Tax=Bacillus sp. JCM 19041 TaxID=1460637 RepID=UPI0006D24A07
MDISSVEATLFGLGLYSDTACLTHSNTGTSDFAAASYLLEKGMNLDIVSTYLQQIEIGTHPLFQLLFDHIEIEEQDGITYAITTCTYSEYVGNVSAVVEELLRLFKPDAIFACIQLKNHTYIIARSRTVEVNVKRITEVFGGGGHARAAAAVMKNEPLNVVKSKLIPHVRSLILPAQTVRTMMSWPVQTLMESDCVNDGWQQLITFGHSGFPIFSSNGEMLGIVSKSDLKKARQLGLGEKSIKSIMTQNVITIHANDSLKQAQKILRQHHIGRLPVVNKDDQLVGILTRSDIISGIHSHPDKVNEAHLTNYFDSKTAQFLKRIGSFADEQQVSVFLVGGVVRDFLLDRPHSDIDLVVEGDAVAFAHQLATVFGGTVKTYEDFGTATWTGELEIDVVTCRKEFYSSAGALPQVKSASITEDLARRDFTINALAMYINATRYGELVDVFKGKNDLQNRKIRILHPLSFKEDPTRLFRAVRFALRLDFLLDEHTIKAAQDTGEAIHFISAQRLHNELYYLENERNLLKAFRLLNDLYIWQYFFGNSLSDNAFVHMNRLSEQGMETGIFYLLAAAHDQKAFSHIRPYMLTKKDRNLLDDLTKPIWEHLPETVGNIHRHLFSCSEEAIIFQACTNPKMETTLLLYVRKRNTLEPLVTGSDLIAAGLKPSPFFSNWLLELECLQLDERIQTKEDGIRWIKKEKNGS